MKFYTKRLCPKCIYIHNALKQENIPYTLIDVDNDKEALEYLKSKGFSTMPIIELDDNTFINDVKAMIRWVEDATNNHNREY